MSKAAANVSGENVMSAKRKSETAQAESQHLQFRLRTLFVWMTGLAVIFASIAGAFGVVLQIVAASLVAFVLGCVALSLVMGGPWVGLVWLLKQLAGHVKNCRWHNR